MGRDLRCASSFAKHQDDADHEKAIVTGICKLTPDRPGEPPSQFCICGAHERFTYGPQSGACSFFMSNAFHESMVPETMFHHLKLAIFWYVVAQSDEPMPKRLRSSGPVSPSLSLD